MVMMKWIVIDGQSQTTTNVILYIHKSYGTQSSTKTSVSDFRHK